MIAGIPGTGLGGVLYLLLGMFMPIAELVRSLRRTGPGRWRAVARQTVNVAGVLAALHLTVRLLQWVLVRWVAPRTPAEEEAIRLSARMGWISSLGTLGLLAVIVNLLPFFVRRRAGR